jgi:hypothetical protein
MPVLERRMAGDFEDRLREWEMAVEYDKDELQRWQKERREAQKKGQTFTKLRPTPTATKIAPEKPRLRQHDVTIEQVAMILAYAAPKGVLIVRDELAGWLTGMNAYNQSGRQFWLEAYGGGFYRVERRKHETMPIDVDRLAVAVYGGTQPERLAELTAGPDDGLFSRFLWAWPEPVTFRLGDKSADVEWAIGALDRLRELTLHESDPPCPIVITLTVEAKECMIAFAREMEMKKAAAGGLMCSAYGKARGLALRLSLVLEYLWWCGKDGADPPPKVISHRAFVTAAAMVADYFMPMAERVYGDAAATDVERNAMTLAKWIEREKPEEVHIRHLQRHLRLPGLRNADQIKMAAAVLIEADWLHFPKVGFGAQSKVSYPVNPKLRG